MSTKNTRDQIGKTISIRWGTSRGRDSYGYTTASLRDHTGKRVAACNGGGYDMRGTVIGNWITYQFRKELLALKPEQMPEHSHWQPERKRICAGACRMEAIKNDTDLPKLPEDCFECPTCKGRTHPSRDGKTVPDGRYFYGLTFHNPNYDPGKAVIGADTSDRTLGGASGQTVAQAEAEGKSVGLERYQAFYSASSKQPTKTHTIPSIDGACGLSSVMQILRAIGLDLKHVHDSAKLDIYEIVKVAKS